MIKKGRDTYEKVFNVEYDKNTDLNVDERKMQYEVVMKMYNMVQDLAYLVYELDAIAKDENIAFQLLLYWPIYCCIPIITVCLPPDGASINGHHKSFQTGTIVNTATVPKAGLDKGSII